LEGIAIIGLSCRFPKAPDVDAFWRNLANGTDGISRFDDAELEAAGVDQSLLALPQFVKAKPWVEGIDLFDAAFFGIPPRDAELMDPQQRFFLECGFEALEDAGQAGHDPERCVGVFAGVSRSTYHLAHLHGRADARLLQNGLQILIGNTQDFLATQLSYRLDLSGPSITVQTACSTSLVAVAMACQSLADFSCDMALAGGVSLTVPEKFGYFYQEGGIVSPDGRCRAFDASANGTVLGDGIGVVVLKRLAEAIADRDPIRAVVRGWCVNNDGASRMFFTAPSVDGQAAAMATALSLGEVEPASVGLVEAHGVGTPLGDSIELMALRRVFGDRKGDGPGIALGSVKASVGHLVCAAGVAGLIKATLALERELIPATLHQYEPNPELDPVRSPFFVNSTALAWPRGARPRRACVNSSGMGGTNAHVVLEEAPAPEPAQGTRPFQLVTLSAQTGSALERATMRLADRLATRAELELADVAHTLRVGRRELPHRLALVCRDREGAIAALRDPGRALCGVARPGGRRVAFLLPGVGDHYAGMGRDLYASERVFREELDRCCAYLAPFVGRDLRGLILGGEESIARPTHRDGRDSEAGTVDLRRMRAARKSAADPRGDLHDTRFAQPAVFALELALARQWMEWGVRPDALLGHSVGEYVAACLSGVFEPEVALEIVAQRAQWIAELAPGAMLAVMLTEREVCERLEPGLELGAVNAQNLCVVSGTPDAVAALETRLSGEGAMCQRLATSHAFHSSVLVPVAEKLARLVGSRQRGVPRIPWISNVTGTWITPEEARDPAYWAVHSCRTVRFAEGVREAWSDGERVLLEVGPGRSLASFALQTLSPPDAAQSIIISSMRTSYEDVSDATVLLGALARLWIAGVPFDARAFDRVERRRRVPLPTYPFERQRYWIEPAAASLPEPAPAIDAKLAADDWFHAPVWRSSAWPVADSANPGRVSAPTEWLVFLDDCGVGAAAVDQLRATGRRAVAVRAAPEFADEGDDTYGVDPGARGDLGRLLSSAFPRGAPDFVLHLRNVSPVSSKPSDLHAALGSQERAFFELLHLGQALADRGLDSKLRLLIASHGLHDVTGREVLAPERATLLGPVGVLPCEIPGVSCSNVDVELPADSAECDALARRLLDEAASDASDAIVAFRGLRRFVRDFERIVPPGADAAAPLLRERGVYLITGGLGGVGGGMAELLARSVGARLALLGRTGLPPRSEWPGLLAHELPCDDRTRERIERVQALERLGADVMVIAGDVGDPAAMRHAVRAVEEHFGALHGVLHAAGLPGGGLIALKSDEAARSVLHPKLLGTLALDAAVGERDLDCFVLFSSGLAVAPALGEVDYCAANAFLDAFAHARSRRRRGRTLSIDWGMWQWDDWQGDALADVPEAQARARAVRDRVGLTFAEGMQGMRRALATGLPQVVVMTQDLTGVRRQFAVLLRASEALTALRGSASRHPRPELLHPYVAPRNDTERRIAEIWQEVLGIEPIGVHDAFLELGGHSLLAMQVVGRIRRELGAEVSLRALFEAGTVAELAARAGNASASTAKATLADDAPPTPPQVAVDALSDADVERLLGALAEPEGPRA
jgi:acyl transferase domain-containing protein/acyl carrier protein